MKKFQRSLPAVTHEVLEAVGMLAAEMGCRAYLVGGIVRDLVIGYPTVDLDITVDGDGVEVARAFARATGAAFKGATRFGTCKVESRAFGTIDFATTRTEVYRHPGALPEVRRSGLEQDLARRDFTINAMAVSLGPEDYGRFIDPYDGLGDIRRHRIRVLHEASFVDDPTRLLRAIRFAARYDFRLERKTRRLVKSCLEGGCLRTISGRRAFAELRLICMEERASAALGMLERLRILEAVHVAFGGGGRPDRARVGRSLDLIENLAGPGFAERWICWFSWLFIGMKGGAVGDVIAHLNPDRYVRDVCGWTVLDLGKTRAALSRLDLSDPYAVTVRLRRVPPEGLVHLYTTAPSAVRRAVRDYLTAWCKVKPSLSGGDIARMGIGEGPLVGRIIEHLLSGRLRGTIKTRADEVAYVKRRLKRRR